MTENTVPQRVIVAALREHPGVWSWIAEYGTEEEAQAHVAFIESGGSHLYEPAGSFDAEARGTNVWACYL